MQRELNNREEYWTTRAQWIANIVIFEQYLSSKLLLTLHFSLEVKYGKLICIKNVQPLRNSSFISVFLAQGKDVDEDNIFNVICRLWYSVINYTCFFFPILRVLYSMIYILLRESSIMITDAEKNIVAAIKNVHLAPWDHYFKYRQYLIKSSFEWYQEMH